jgi:hypothetical protein
MSTERTPLVTDERVEQVIKALYPINGLTKGPDTRMQLIRRVAAERMACELRDIYEATLSRKDAEIEALRNPWISVHDRLPENDDTVFVMLDYYQADMDGPDVVGLSSSGEYDTGSLVDGAVLADHFNDDDVDVTHWMPLPSQTKP